MLLECTMTQSPPDRAALLLDEVRAPLGPLGVRLLDARRRHGQVVLRPHHFGKLFHGSGGRLLTSA